MKSLDLNTTNFLIIVGSFNNEYNLGFNLYQLNPAEKAIIHKNQNIEAINPIHFQFSNNKRTLYSACASGEDEGKNLYFWDWLNESRFIVNLNGWLWRFGTLLCFDGP